MQSENYFLHNVNTRAKDCATTPISIQYYSEVASSGNTHKILWSEKQERMLTYRCVSPLMTQISTK